MGRGREDEIADNRPNLSGENQTVELVTGQLRFRVTQANWPLERLCGFGSRRNLKRGFLFVSRVLGRHIPVRPFTMRAVWRELAFGIHADLPGPIVFVGMAETAVCLGQGVHDEYVHRTRRSDVLFIHTTRHHFTLRPCALEFREEHSHAPDHRLYCPHHPDDAHAFAKARSLVVVDDEASTGQSFSNLVQAFSQIVPTLERVCGVVITDWRDLAGPSAAKIKSPHTFVSLLKGTHHFDPRPELPLELKLTTSETGGPKDDLLPRNFGRFGLRVFPEPSDEFIDRLKVRPGERVLVLGTGEFVALPFRIAERLEAKGADTYCQATTRSPARIGHDIRNAIEFSDNYGDGVPNYLYNVRAGDYDRVFICYETPIGTLQPELAAALPVEPHYF